MVICGVLGLIFEDTQKIMTIVFGCIFGIKCLRMFLICIREYRKCQSELDNYYDSDTDIKWIRNLIYLSLFMSVVTIVSFYIHTAPVLLSYYISIPIIYSYIVYRVLDFMPKKIETIRHKNITLQKNAEEKENKEKLKELGDKIAPKIEKWVEEKMFCQADLNIKDVSMQMGTNQSYLSSYLNRHMNMTFQLWLNKLRIEESKKILTNGEKLSIEEVGIKVGIPQSYNFSRWFKTITDMTPYQYRKSYKETR
jgi:AraC-like DNA-binding protein